MALDNYENLITAIAKWSKRTDIADFIPDFIMLAERRIDATLRMKDNEYRATAYLGRDDKYITLPRNFIEMRTLRILTNGLYRKLRYCPPESMVFGSAKGMPMRYTVNSRLEFDCVPDRDYQLEMIYFYGLDPLGPTESSMTNNVLKVYPQLYLYGALAEVAKWAKDTEDAIYYDSLFSEVMSTANTKERKGRLGPSPSPVYPGYYP